MNRYHFDEEVYRMLENFYTVSGLRVGIHDLDMNILIEYPPKSEQYENLRFCDKMRYHSMDFKERCSACDRSALESALLTKRPFLYHCHMGFSEAIVPIVCEGTVICILMIGQIRNESTSEDTLHRTVAFLPDCVRTHETLSDMRKSFYQMPEVSDDRFHALIYFLENCAQIILTNHMIQKNSGSLIADFVSYVEDNINKCITISSVADYLGCSTSHLSRKLSNELHTTFTDYLTKRRIEAAKNLLISTNLSVKQIAVTLCYDEPTYFMRIFKQNTGLTCQEYRNTVRCQRQLNS